MITTLALILPPVILAVMAGHLARKVHKMSQATDRLTSSVLALGTSVDALISKAATSDDAAVNTAADAVDALKIKVDAAVNPVSASPTTAPGAPTVAS